MMPVLDAGGHPGELLDRGDHDVERTVGGPRGQALDWGGQPDPLGRDGGQVRLGVPPPSRLPVGEPPQADAEDRRLQLPDPEVPAVQSGDG